MKSRGSASWPSLTAIVAASMVVIRGWAGASPALWLDTLNDQYEVRQCVLEGACTLIGQAASVKGVFLAGGWLLLRALLYRLGLDLDGVHLLLQAFDAVGVGLVALAGYRLGGRALAGPAVGATAAYLLVVKLGETGATRQAVYNSTPVAALGAVLLLACVAAVERPGLLPTVVTALLAAVMANFHTACATTGVTVVWVALLGPGRRLLRAAAAGVVFAGGAFVISPLAWIANVRHILAGASAAAEGVPRPPASLAAITEVLHVDRIAWYATLGVAAWVFCLVTRWSSVRRALDVPIALTAPHLALFVMALRRGVPDAGGKYLAHVKPGAALALAVALVALATWVLGRVLPMLQDALPGRPRSLREAGALGLRLAPWAAALAILRTPSALPRDPLRFPLFTMRDIAAIGHVLYDERGWTRARVRYHVKATEQSTVLAALLDEIGGGNDHLPSWAGVAAADAAAPDDDPTDAILIKVDASELPDPLPPSWTIAQRTGELAAVIVFTPSWLDWRHAEICTTLQAGWRCFHDGEPSHYETQPGPMILRVPLRTPPAAPAVPTRIFMPRLVELCGGRVAAVSGSHVDPDHRHALVSGGGSGSVDIAWDLYSPACPDHLSHIKPHFFLEADVADAAALEAILRRREP